jgi:hypothetical protein
MVRYNVHTCADPYEDNPIEYERKGGGGERITILHALFWMECEYQKDIAVFILGT